MAELEPNQQEHIRYLVADIFAECRINAQLYESSGFLQLDINGAEWEVQYDAGNDYTSEELTVFRDYRFFDNAMYYKFYASDGEALKNEKIKRRFNGNAKYTIDDERPVTDPLEIEFVHSIVAAVHNINRPIV